MTQNTTSFADVNSCMLTYMSIAGVANGNGGMWQAKSKPIAFLVKLQSINFVF